MTAIRLLLVKDLRTLVRARVLLAALLLYPLLIAVLVGLVARFAEDEPRVGFVDLDGIPRTLEVGGERFDVNALIEEVEDEVDLVPLSEAEADDRLRRGDTVATIVVPRGFVSRLRSFVGRPELVLRITRGGLSGRVERQTEALVYNLNRRLQDAFIAANLEYVRLIREGGRGNFLGNEFDIVGLDGARRLLTELEAEAPAAATRARIDELQTFVREAELALDQTGETLQATANPIVLRQDDAGRRSRLLSAQVQAYALALTVALLCLVVAAGAIAAEREENVLGRLARGLVRLEELVAEKVALVALIGLGLGLVLAVALGGAIELAGSSAFASWGRLPLLALGLAVAGAAFGAFGVLLGCLAREPRAAALVALLVAIPIVLLGLIPEVTVAPVRWLSAAFPFAHAVELFESSLYDTSPWRAVGRELAWLLALTAAFGLAARLGVRRLLA